jgi:hypothetical protein
MSPIIWCASTDFFGIIPAQGSPPLDSWIFLWQLQGGQMPSVVLDFVNNRYYDGTTTRALLSSMVQNTGTVDSTGLTFTGANNVNCIGPLATALGLPAVSVGVALSNNAAGTAVGILAFGSGNPDGPILGDDTGGAGGGFFNAWNGASNITAFVNQASYLGTPCNVGSAWNSSLRTIIFNNTGGVANVGSTYAQPVTGPKLGNYGANVLPFFGKMRSLAVYPVKVSDILLTGLSWRGPWLTPIGVRGVKITNGGFCDASQVLNFHSNQSWTVTSTWFLQTGNLNPAANVIFTNVGTGPPWTGYEAFVNSSGLVIVRLMSGWDGSSATNLIEVQGNSNVCDAHNIFNVSYDGSSTAAGVKIYLNGSPMSMTTNVDNLTGDIFNFHDFLVCAQEDGGGGGTFCFNDLMMTFIVDNTVRSSSYISQYCSPTGFLETQPPVDANTQLYYDFRELTGTTTADKSPNGFNGTLQTPFVWVTALL